MLRKRHLVKAVVSLVSFALGATAMCLLAQPGPPDYSDPGRNRTLLDLLRDLFNR